MDEWTSHLSTTLLVCVFLPAQGATLLREPGVCVRALAQSNSPNPSTTEPTTKSTKSTKPAKSTRSTEHDYVLKLPPPKTGTTLIAEPRPLITSPLEILRLPSAE